jgi:glycerol-3-phosphate acyltransferase PlsX
LPLTEFSVPQVIAAGTVGGVPVSSERTVVIAVDAMGGDYAPAEVVRGAAIYLHTHAAEDNSAVLLVGDEARIRAELRDIEAGGRVHANYPKDRLGIVASSQLVGMDEHPMEAFRDKPDSSIAYTIQLVQEGRAHGAFSAGNTGAFMVTATQVLQRIEGVKRPAIATLFPKETGGSAVVVDAGANVDCRPSQLVQFALLGSIYAEHVLGVRNPRVGLLSNGEEDAKGNELVYGARTLLQNAGPGVNFVGNVEGNHVFEGGVDVVVCDGFVGNVLLKGAEGIVRLVLSLLSAEAKNAPDEITREALLASLLRLRQRVDYAEFGGAPLLGVNGPVFIAHGRSDSRAIATGIRIAAQASRSGYVSFIRESLKGAAA